MITTFEVIALITSGLIVGFVNTLAGGGTIISLTLFMMLGLSPVMANGTNRIPVILQNITSLTVFYRKKLLDIRKGVVLSTPVVFGSLLGSQFAVNIDQSIFEKVMAVVLVFMLIFMVYEPERWIKGNHHLQVKKLNWQTFLLLFLCGIYGGFVHVGVGYPLLAILVLGFGYDILQANVFKGFIVLLYVPFSLIIFAINKQINYEYALIHSVGNIIGAFIASHFAVKNGVKFVRWAMIIIILICALQLFGLLNLGKVLSLLMA